MTCIIGMIDKKNRKVIMGTDSQASVGTGRKVRIPKNNMKISKYKNTDDLIIGFSGSVNLITQLKYGLDFQIGVKEGEELNLNVQYILKYILPQIVDIKKKLKEYKNKETGSQPSCDILIGFKDKLFLIKNTYEVYEYTEDCEYFCIGSGEDTANMVLDTLSDIPREEMTMEYKIFKALIKSVEYNVGVGYPLHISYSTEDTILTQLYPNTMYFENNNLFIEKAEIISDLFKDSEKNKDEEKEDKSNEKE